MTSSKIHRPLVVIQRNPTSGSGRGKKRLRQLIVELRQRNFRVRLFANRSRLDHFVAHLSDEQSLHCIVAAGGDGTICNVLQRHPDRAIAIFPLGTENLVARYLQIDGCPSHAAQMIQQRHLATFDTAFANHQRFLIMASVGFDSEVAYRMSKLRRGNIRKWNYLRPILSAIWGYRFPTMNVFDREGNLLGQGSHVIVANIKEYGFRFPFCPLADPTDGLLDIRIYRGTGVFRTLGHCIKLRCGWKFRPEIVERFRRSQVRIEAVGSAVAQIDGDPLGPLPVEIRVEPKSLQLIVPSKFNL